MLQRDARRDVLITIRIKSFILFSDILNNIGHKITKQSNSETVSSQGLETYFVILFVRIIDATKRCAQSIFEHYSDCFVFIYSTLDCSKSANGLC